MPPKRQQTSAHPQPARIKQAKEKSTKSKGQQQKKAYEAKLKAEKRNPRCEDCEICCESRAPHRFLTCDDRRKPHRYCEVCVRSHLRDAIFVSGSPWMRCLGDGCVAFYRKKDYERILEPDALNMRNRLEMKANLKDVKGMTSCSACDFAAFMDKGVDIFECRNPKCLKRICVKCGEESHGEMSCVAAGKRKREDAAKESGGDSSTALRDELRRHVANMISEALIRYCKNPGCDAAFVKEAGCNEMRCKCGVKMCYACKAQPIDHTHWFHGTCVHFESTEAREESERKAAEWDAIAKVLREHPNSGLTEKDLKVGEFSRAVQRDDKKKRRKEQTFLTGGAWDPSMGIEGGDEDMMAEIQAQMAGIDFADITGRWGGIPQRPQLGGVPIRRGTMGRIDAPGVGMVHNRLDTQNAAIQGQGTQDLQRIADRSPAAAMRGMTPTIGSHNSMDRSLSTNLAAQRFGSHRRRPGLPAFASRPPPMNNSLMGRTLDSPMHIDPREVYADFYGDELDQLYALDELEEMQYQQMLMRRRLRQSNSIWDARGWL